MKGVKTLERTLGHQLFFPSTSVGNLLSEKARILDALNDHGCVVVKNVNFNEKEMVQFTKGFWDQVIQLPKFLCFNNQHQDFKQIARVGNVLLDGTLKDSQKEATYWHQDGNFWGEEKKHIYNCLHTRQEPYEGGETHVMDLVKGAKFLKEKHPDVYKRLKQIYGILNVEEINDFKLYNAKNTMGIEGITRHQLLKMNGRRGQEVLFLSVHKFMSKQDHQEPKDITVTQVQQLLEKQMEFYAHKWQKGDLLIWDNLQVIHRSSGNFKGRRLLFRTQGRFNE